MTSPPKCDRSDEHGRSRVALMLPRRRSTASRTRRRAGEQQTDVEEVTARST